MKENDYLLNMLSNPDFNESDFREAGLTAENTSIEKNLEVYKNLDFVKDNPLVQTDGKFDEIKFNKIHNIALQSYNNFISGITSEKIALEHDFYRNDIYAPYEERNTNIEAVIHREVNPLRLRKGLVHATDVMDSPYSVREIAQTQKVWDEATKSWQDAPNESFFSNFLETRVLALWDKDGEHTDPISGKLVKHKKGDKKINENGTFYYENLNGRSIYGREVLSKFDTLTVDGTFVNKFDFFDSDDKEKSITGSLVKNAIKVIPAFIPIVSPVYIGLRVGLNTVDLMAKLGKVFTGSESPTLSAMEGFAKSMSFSSSDYALGSSETNAPAHAWSMENILNMGADVFTLLAEQRWIFSYAPAIIKGRAGLPGKLGKSAADKIKKDAWLAKNPNKSLQERLSAILKSGKNTLESKEAVAKVFGDYEVLSSEIGELALRTYMKSYHELGKVLSQAYMTGVTVGDAYGEAKQEGASDVEASLLTLGYAIAEYSLLNSDIGQWILPELKADKQRFKGIAKLLINNPKPSKGAPVSEKMNWVSKLVKFGKDAANKVYNNTSNAVLPSMAAGAVAEGVEEVSEELLYDVSKSLFNVVGYLRGDDTRLTAFNDVANRYALSFVGGALGGSIAGAQSGYREAKVIKNLDNKDAAFQLLVHIVKEGKANDFLSTVDKMTWNSQDLSAVNSVNIDGTTSYLPGTSKDNLNKAIKDAMHQQVAIILRILDANGALVDDESLLGLLTNADKDLRYMALLKSTFAASFLQEFNDISARIVEISEKLNRSVTDEEARSENYKQEQNNLKQLLKVVLDEKDAFIKGERSGDYIKRALFEMSEDISSLFIDVNKIQWIENKEGKKIKDISPERLKVLEEDWNKWSEYARKDKLELAFRIFENSNLLASEMLKLYNFNYLDEVKNSKNVIHDIQEVLGSRVASYTAQDMNGDYGVADDQLIEVSLEGSGLNFKIFNSPLAVILNILTNKFEQVDPIKFEKYNNALNSIFNSENNSEQSLQLVYMMEELLLEDDLVNSIIEDINNISYINYASRTLLLQAFESIYENDFIDEAVEENVIKITDAIRKKPFSPVLDLINSWSLSLDNLDISVQKLLTELNILYTDLSGSNNLDNFSIQELNAKRLDVALANIKLLKASILAARTDGVSGSNRVGYNVTVNEILKQDLAEIDKNNANVLLLDINKIENLLQYYKRLHIVNTGLKLKEHYKVSVNKDIIAFNSLKKLVLEHDWPPKDWNNSEEFKNIFKDNFEIIDTISGSLEERRLVLNDTERVSLKRDMQKIDSAVHKFFLDNKDKLSDSKELSKLFSYNLFNFQELDDSILSANTENLNDTLLVWWLATRAAINPTDFYKTFKDNFISGIAPIPALEQAIMTAVAGVLNGEVFYNFALAYNESLRLKTESLDDSYFSEIALKGRSYTKNDYLDSDRAIQFFRHLLIEGVAGSGKSTAVAKSIVNILRTSDKGKELLNEVWFVHASKELALKMAEDLGYGENYKNAYSREEYLELISPKISELRTFNESGNLALEKENLIQRPGETLYRYNAQINKGLTKNPPSMIFMDEVTGFSLQDLLLSEDFAEHYGIVNLTFGDFVLDGLQGTMPLEDDLILNSEVFRGNFAGPIKLGDSLRTANGVKDYNNKLLLAQIYKILNEGELSIEALNLKWYTDGTKNADYLDATTILGDKIYNSYSDIEQIKSDIDVLLKQLPDKEKLADHEKLGFIYDDEESPIYLYLKLLNEGGTFKDKILLKKGSSSQGMEADYYVVDLHNNNSDVKAIQKHYRRVYTGLTRAKKASIAILRQTNAINENASLNPEEVPGEFSLNATGIEKFSLDIKHEYDQVYNEGEQLKYIKFNNREQKASVEVVEGKEYEELKLLPPDIPVDPGVRFSYEGEDFTVKSYVKDSNGSQYLLTMSDKGKHLWEILDFKKNVLPLLTMSKTPVGLLTYEKLDEDNLDKIDIVNNNESELNMLLHSFATNESGIIEEVGRLGKVKYKVGPGFSNNKDKRNNDINGRVDGINGIIKILGITVDSEGYIDGDVLKLYEKLNHIRSAALYAKSQLEILEVLTTQIPKLNGKTLNTRLIFKSSSIPGKNGEINEQDWLLRNGSHSKFFKSIKEKIRGLFTNSEPHVSPTQKHISIVITEHDGSKESAILEIPLVNLTNPMTMLETKGFEEVKKVFNRVESRLAGKNTVKILEATISELKANPVKMSESFVKLTKLYLEFGNGRVLLLDDIFKNPEFGLKDGEITLSNIFAGTGPLMTSTEKGTGTTGHAKYRDSEVSYSGKWMDLETYKRDSGKIVSSIFVTTAEIPDLDIKVGHPFVLVSDAIHKFKTEVDLVEYYKLQEQNKVLEKMVKLVYVSPPTVSVAKYLENVDAVFRRNKTPDPYIGSDFTSFNLLKIIMQHEKEMLKNPKLMAKILTEEGSSYAKIRAKVAEFAKALEDMSSKEFNELLSKDEGLLDFATNVLGKATSFKSWKSFLQGQLRWYMMSGFAGQDIQSIDSDIVIKRISALEKILKDHYNINGIFYDPQLSRNADSNIGGFKKVINNDANNGYTINGKIDTKAFKGNVLPLIDAILIAGFLIDKDTATYIRDNYAIYNKKNDGESLNEILTKLLIINEIINNQFMFNDNSIKQSVKTIITDKFNNISFLDLSNFEDIIKDLVKDIANNYIIFPIPNSEASLVLNPNTSNGKIIMGNDSSTVTINNVTYKVVNISQNAAGKWEVEFLPVSSQRSSTNNIENINIEDFKNIIGYLFDELSDDPIDLLGIDSHEGILEALQSNDNTKIVVETFELAPISIDGVNPDIVSKVINIIKLLYTNDTNNDTNEDNNCNLIIR